MYRFSVFAVGMFALLGLVMWLWFDPMFAVATGSDAPLPAGPPLIERLPALVRDRLSPEQIRAMQDHWGFAYPASGEVEDRGGGQRMIRRFNLGEIGRASCRERV